MSKNFNTEIQPLSQPSPVLSYSTIHWRNGTPVNGEFDDSYYSDENGLEESKYVFLKSNRLPQRWLDFNASQKSNFSIIETGFGSGRNFFNTASAWYQYQSSHKPHHLKKLVYTSIEGFPLKKEDLKQIINSWSSCIPATQLSLTTELLNVYPLPIKGIYSFTFGSIELNLFFMPLDQALTEFQPKGKAPFDCLFLDGFSPAKNQTMWHSTSIRRLSFLCKHGATFSTFTAASNVRRILTHCGFLVNRQKGYGRKREMLTGIMRREKYSPYRTKTPWYHYLTTNKPAAKPVVIIGGGVAGCATANALANQGINCQIIEYDAHLGGTCGTLKRSLYSPHLTADFNVSSKFYWHAYQHLEQYLHTAPQVVHKQSGIFFIADNKTREKHLSAVYKLFAQFGQACTWLAENQNQVSTGIAIDHPGLLFKYGGWLDGHSLCKNLCNHEAIQTKVNTTVENLYHEKNNWIIETNRGVIESSHVVLCTGWAIRLLERFNLCKLEKIKGQTTSIANLPALSSLKIILNNGHYLIPATSDTDNIIVGASYENIICPDTLADIKTDIENLSAFKNINLAVSKSIDHQLKNLGKSKNSFSSAGIRLCTRDHLPIIGPVPDMDFFNRNYSNVIQSGRLKNCPDPAYIPGLYVNTAHGSRGVTASILSGKLISAMVTGNFRPLPNSVLEAVNPARFFVRDQLSEIKSNQVY